MRRRSFTRTRRRGSRTRAALAAGALLITLGGLQAAPVRAGDLPRASPGAAKAQAAWIPAGHWAHAAVRRLVEAGLVEQHDAFHGERPMTRLGAASLLHRVMARRDGIGKGRAAYTPEDIATLEKLAAELAPELAVVSARLAGMQERSSAARDEMSAIRDRMERRGRWRRTNRYRQQPPPGYY
jgi:hypothetical protein